MLELIVYLFLSFSFGLLLGGASVYYVLKKLAIDKGLLKEFDIICTDTRKEKKNNETL